MDGRVVITAPPGAVEAATYIRHIPEIDAIPVPGKVIFQSFSLDAWQAADQSPVYAFRSPIQIAIQLGNLNPDWHLTLATWNAPRWESLPTTFDPLNKTLTAQTFHFSSFAVIASVTAQVAIQLAPPLPGQNSTTIPHIFFDDTISYSYSGGSVTLSSTPDGAGGLLTDDEVLITVTRPDETSATYNYNYIVPCPICIAPTLPEDVTYLFLPGDNQVQIQLIDRRRPNYWTQGYYLVEGATVISDTMPPVISNVYWRQDGAGQTLISAVITDNVAVAAASVWWNNQEFPMQPVGGDRYQVVIPVQVNGIVGHFSITAVDPSGNLAVWPDSGTQAERIRYTNWAGLKKNTQMVGEPVNTATGSFFTQHLDVLAPGPGMPFEFRRSYNSVAAALDGPLGFGWTHNFSIHLQPVDDLMLHGVVVTYEDGHTANFEVDGSGYRAPAGDQNILAHEGSGFVITWPDQTKYHFDGNGKLTGVEDSNQNSIQLSYTGNSLTQIRDTAGRVYQLEYDGHRIKKISDVLGRTYEYTYDGAGNLQTYKNPEQGLLQYTYDGEHWLTSITDPNTHTFVTNTYDERGRVIEQEDASHVPSFIRYIDERHVEFTDNEGHITQHAYDTNLRIMEETDAKGKSLTYQYDADDNVIQMTDRGSHATVMAYDDFGNVLTHTDSLSQTAIFQYDSRNNLIYEKDEAGAETSYTYDASHNNLKHIHATVDSNTAIDIDMTYYGNGLLKTLTDANNHVTQFTFDAQGNLQTVEDALHFITRFEHDGVGRRTAMIDANGHRVRFEYDGNDRIKTIFDPKDRPTCFTYDPVGNLLSVTDRRGFTTAYEYNENDSLIKVTDPLSNTASFTYDKIYHRKTFTNWRHFTTTYDYDALYNLVMVTDAKGNPTNFGYDADRNLVSVTDALTQTTTFDYDPLHRVITVTNPLSGTTVYGYDPVGRPVQVRDPKDGVTQYQYDLLGRLLKVTDALSNTTSFSYDPTGNITATTNARNFITLYDYDAVNQLIRQTNPLSHTLQLGYDGVGNVLTMTNPLSNTTLFAYDANDNLMRVTDALSGAVTYTYDEEDNRLSVADQNSHTTLFGYDPLGNPITMTLPLSQTTLFRYDENSNLIDVINAKNKTTHFAYDELDLLKSRTDPLTFVTDYEYDALRRLIKVADAEGNPTQYLYDALDRLIGVTDALSQTTGYGYDPLGNLTVFTDTNSNATTFGVDLLGRVISETNPISNTWLYDYDGVGNLVQRTGAKSVVTDYTFDADDRLTHIEYPSDPDVDLGYDANDNLIRLTDASGAAAFSYDKLDRLIRVERMAGILAGKTLGYGYDPASNRTRVTYPDGKVVRYGYNADDWLISVTSPLTSTTVQTTTYEYDPVGLPTHIQNPNGTWADFTYDDADRLVRLFNGKPDASTNVISSFEYTLDKVGNRVRTVEQSTRGQLITWVKDYTYDNLYRLTQAVETPDYNPAQALTSTFAYDAVGNRLAMAANIQDAPNTPPLPEMVTTVYTYNAANQMLTAGATQFGYDANGSRTSMIGPERVISYTYDVENRLIGAETFDVQPDGGWHYDSTLDFTYDGLGRRMQRGVIDNGVRKTADFLYDGLGYDPLAQYVDPGEPRTTFYYRDPQRVLSRHEIQGDGTGLQYFHHYDGLGDVSAWTNQSGQETQEYTYAPYGRLIDNNGPDNASNKTDPHNSLTFSGKLWDKETELYYFGARDYDPATGTWLTQDKYRGRLAEPVTLQRYGYVGDNPINWIDQYGFDMGPKYVPRGTRAKDWYTKFDLDNPKEAGASASLRSSVQTEILAKWGSKVVPEILKAAIEEALKHLAQGGRYLEITNINMVIREVETILTRKGVFIRSSTSSFNFTVISEKTTALATWAGRLGKILPYGLAAWEAVKEARTAPPEERAIRASGAATWSLASSIVGTSLGVTVAGGVTTLLGAVGVTAGAVGVTGVVAVAAPIVAAVAVVAGVGVLANHIWGHGGREAWTDLIRYPPWSPKPAQ